MAREFHFRPTHRFSQASALRAVVLVIVLLLVSSAAAAELPAGAPDATADTETKHDWHAAEPWRTDRFFLATSVYTRHYSYSPEHNDHQHLIQGEWNATEHWLAGLALFDNSFDQPTQYLYGGYRFRPLDNAQPFFIKVTAGLVHGYKDQYQDKIPMNEAGIAPVIIPSVGYCLNRFCSEIVIFGAAGAMVTIGLTIP
jgi:hypothetical protein